MPACMVRVTNVGNANVSCCVAFGAAGWGGSVASVRLCALYGPLAAIQSQTGCPPFFFLPFVYFQRFTASAYTSRPICPSLDWPQSSGGVVGGFSPAQGAAADHPRSPVVLRCFLSTGQRTCVPFPSCERSEPLIATATDRFLWWVWILVFPVGLFPIRNGT